jgi:hypothetical protein
MVEAFFRDLTENRLKRGVFRSVLALIEALDEYVDHHNAEPKPFIWTAGAQDIVARVMRAQGTLNKRQNIGSRPLKSHSRNLVFQ